MWSIERVTNVVHLPSDVSSRRRREPRPGVVAFEAGPMVRTEYGRLAPRGVGSSPRRQWWTDSGPAGLSDPPTAG